VRLHEVKAKLESQVDDLRIHVEKIEGEKQKISGHDVLERAKEFVTKQAKSNLEMLRRINGAVA
jgi:hypothetical protein